MAWIQAPFVGGFQMNDEVVQSQRSPAPPPSTIRSCPSVDWAVGADAVPMDGGGLPPGESSPGAVDDHLSGRRSGRLKSSEKSRRPPGRWTADQSRRARRAASI